MNFFEKLTYIANNKTALNNFGNSKWRNLETETIATEIILKCQKAYQDYGIAFCWQGRSTLTNTDGIYNANAVRQLILQDMITLEKMPLTTSGLQPVGDVVFLDGVPMIFTCKENLLDYAIQIIKRNQRIK